METQKLYVEMEVLWERFQEEHSKSTKKAHGVARKSLTQIKKLISEYKKASVAEDKAK